jgi:formylmethanofuran dehydrogenase subunit E
MTEKEELENRNYEEAKKRERKMHEKTLEIIKQLEGFSIFEINHILGDIKDIAIQSGIVKCEGLLYNNAIEDFKRVFD